MQERSHPFAMKSQVWLLDPRPNLPTIVKMVEEGFELSEASQHAGDAGSAHPRLPRPWPLHLPRTTRSRASRLREALENPRRDTERVVLPPASYLHEREKIEQRWPAAVKFIKERKLNEFFGPESADVGIVVQGGMYNSVMRALQQLGLADVYGETVSADLLPQRHLSADRRRGRRVRDRTKRRSSWSRKASLNSSSRRSTPSCAAATSRPRSAARTCCRWPANTRRRWSPKASRRFSSCTRKNLLGNAPPPPDASEVLADPKIKELAKTVPPRPPSFCIGCPERPIFAAMKLVQQELGAASDRRRHRLPSVREPAAVQHRRHHDGLWAWPGVVVGLQRQGRQEADLGDRRRRLLAQRPVHQHRQRRLQQARRRHHGGRQFLFGGDRRPGHHVLARAQSGALDQQHHRRCGEGRRRQMGAPHRPHLRRGQDARHACARR